MKALIILACATMLIGCAKIPKGAGVVGQITTVYGFEAAYDAQNYTPTVRGGLITHRYFFADTNTEREVIMATDADNYAFGKSKVHTVFSTGPSAVTQESAGQQMLPPARIGADIMPIYRPPSTNQPKARTP